eukprot:138014-Chlamydomonas_euryale.AAC.4
MHTHMHALHVCQLTTADILVPGMHAEHRNLLMCATSLCRSCGTPHLNAAVVSARSEAMDSSTVAATGQLYRSRTRHTKYLAKPST